MQWEHYAPKEATSELEDAMRLTHPFFFNFAEHLGGSSVAFLFNFVKHRGQCCCKGEGNVTPRF